jgi:hypothetical protein
MSKSSVYISPNSSEYGSDPFPNLSTDPDEGNGTWKNVKETIGGGKRRRMRKSRNTRKSRKNRSKRRRR